MSVRVRWALVVAGGLVAVLAAVAVVGELVAHLDGDGGALSAAVDITLALVTASWFAVGAYLARRRPRHPLGWLFVGVGLVAQAGVTGGIAERVGWIEWTASPLGFVVDGIGGLGLFLLLGLLPVLYPDGTIVGRGPWAVAALTVVGAVWAQVQVLLARFDPQLTWLFGPPPTGAQPVWSLWLPWLTYFAGVIGGWVLCATRLARAGHPLRQQLAWLLVSVVAVMITQALGDSLVAGAVQAAALLLLPVAIAVGVIRYQLLDIDTVVPRAITAGVLGIAVAAVYLAVTALSGAGLTGATVPSVIAAAVVAAVLLPLHARVRRLVDRFVYGKRADPIRAVSDLGAAVSGIEDEGDMLRAVLAEVAVTFRARGARIRGADGVTLAESGDSGAHAAVGTRLSLGGETIGSLELVGPVRGGGYTSADLVMLEAMAGTVALAVHAAALADALQQQRDAVVEASALARDRVRRDLHDGLGPSLTGLRLGLRALADALDASEHDRAAAIAGVLAAESDRAVTEVRRVIDDLRPVDLDDADLSSALRRRLESYPAGAPVTVVAHDLPPLPAPLEDGIFRVVTEAVANAQRHASARAVRVEVHVAGATLVARITDDGVGMPSSVDPGVGLGSMRARAAELGGSLDIHSAPGEGTAVTLTLPLDPRATWSGVAS